jgi:hypothetical protein
MTGKSLRARLDQIELSFRTPTHPDITPMVHDLMPEFRKALDNREDPRVREAASELLALEQAKVIELSNLSKHALRLILSCWEAKRAELSSQPLDAKNNY